MAQRQVQNTDVHALTIVPRHIPVCNRPIDGRDNITGISTAVGVQHAQVDQARARSHAGVQAVGALAGTSQNACHVSAVSKWVGTNGGPVCGEVDVIDDIVQISMSRDAAVNHSDTHAAARRTEPLKGVQCARRTIGGFHAIHSGSNLHWMVMRNHRDPGLRSQHLDKAQRQPDGEEREIPIFLVQFRTHRDELSFHGCGKLGLDDHVHPFVWFAGLQPIL